MYQITQMGFNLFLDIAALTILSFLIFSIILKKQIIGSSNKIYLGIIGGYLYFSNSRHISIFRTPNVNPLLFNCQVS
ncbi:MAG: hypothetical protein E7178_04540 [Erysipelotrichaceae bacterium]|nr:hypothetical protein [Erysipelotrichaceae bacterium]